MENQETVLAEDDIIISETDEKGFITYANETFCRISFFTMHELVGANHNIVRHPSMPRCAFWWLWEDIRDKGFWQGYVKNRAKDGWIYWVHASVIKRIDKKDGNVYYCSIRTKPPRHMVETMEGLYRQLSEIERVGGMLASIRELVDLGTLDKSYLTKSGQQAPFRFS